PRLYRLFFPAFLLFPAHFRHQSGTRRSRRPAVPSPHPRFQELPLSSRLRPMCPPRRTLRHELTPVGLTGAQRPSSEPPNRYLSFLSRFPSMSNSCFWPANSAALFPLNLSPSIVSVKSRGNSLPLNFRTAENVRVLSFSFASLSFSSFWSGQLIVPASLSPSS